MPFDDHCGIASCALHKDTTDQEPSFFAKVMAVKPQKKAPSVSKLPTVAVWAGIPGVKCLATLCKYMII